MRRGNAVALLVGSIWLANAAGVTSEDGANGATLAGTWTGKKDEWQAGNCSGGDKDLAVRLIIGVQPDGELTANVMTARTFQGQSLRQSSQWHGQFSAPDKVEFAETKLASCRGEDREYTLRLRGKIRTKDGKLRLVLDGKDETCPEMGCVFHERFTLER